VAAAVSSNIFVYKNNALYTPAFDEGGVNGIMQKIVIEVCRQEGIEVHEIRMNKEQLLAAEEIFITNAIIGLHWIGVYGKKTYTNKFATDLLYILNEQKDKHSLVSP
jgi:branched-chain amino acid aminotransferase